MGVQVNEIYNESCFETMSRMDDKSIDLIITSPPYNKAGYEGFIRKRHKGDSWKQRNVEYSNNVALDFMDDSEYQAEQVRALNEFSRILKDDGSVFYNHKVRVAKHKASHPIEWITRSELIFRQQIVWNRKGSAALAPIRYLPTTELIFWLTKRQTQPNFKRKKDTPWKGEVWNIVPRPNKLHPAPYPEELPWNIMYNIEKTDDVVVYDPYCGIGTTLVVAVEFGFSFIGSEIDKTYWEISRKRIRERIERIKEKGEEGN